MIQKVFLIDGGKMNCFICKAEVKELFKMRCKINNQDIDVDICSSCNEKIFQEQYKTIKYGYSMGYHVCDVNCQLCKENK